MSWIVASQDAGSIKFSGAETIIMAVAVTVFVKKSFEVAVVVV